MTANNLEEINIKSSSVITNSTGPWISVCYSREIVISVNVVCVANLSSGIKNVVMK